LAVEVDQIAAPGDAGAKLPRRSATSAR